MEELSSSVTTQYLKRRKPFVVLTVKLVVGAGLILAAFELFSDAIKARDTNEGKLAGWLAAPIVWLLISAHRTWRSIPKTDRRAEELKRPRVFTASAFLFLLATLTLVALIVAIRWEQRQARSQRIQELLAEGKALEPANTKNRLEVRSIVGRDVRSFADFRAQTADLRVALDENDALAVKRNELLNQLTYEFSDSPDALSMLELFKQITAEDSKASSVFRAEIACSDTLERSDETQQKRFVLLCEVPALREMVLSASATDNLLKQAQQKGATLPPDIVEALK
jgi:hypothetical protein